MMNNDYYARRRRPFSGPRFDQPEVTLTAEAQLRQQYLDTAIQLLGPDQHPAEAVVLAQLFVDFIEQNDKRDGGADEININEDMPFPDPRLT